eukprot:m.8861 g.8861  ORF g.8861 m.8861 type:complete len:558 (+) comp2344_c0_seq1:116-1789(+)
MSSADDTKSQQHITLDRSSPSNSTPHPRPSFESEPLPRGTHDSESLDLLSHVALVGEGGYADTLSESCGVSRLLSAAREDDQAPPSAAAGREPTPTGKALVSKGHADVVSSIHASVHPLDEDSEGIDGAAGRKRARDTPDGAAQLFSSSSSSSSSPPPRRAAISAFTDGPSSSMAPPSTISRTPDGPSAAHLDGLQPRRRSLQDSAHLAQITDVVNNSTSGVLPSEEGTRVIPEIDGSLGVPPGSMARTDSALDDSQGSARGPATHRCACAVCGAVFNSHIAERRYCHDCYGALRKEVVRVVKLTAGNTPPPSWTTLPRDTSLDLIAGEVVSVGRPCLGSLACPPSAYAVGIEPGLRCTRCRALASIRLLPDLTHQLLMDAQRVHKHKKHAPRADSRTRREDHRPASKLDHRSAGKLDGIGNPPQMKSDRKQVVPAPYPQEIVGGGVAPPSGAATPAGAPVALDVARQQQQQQVIFLNVMPPMPPMMVWPWGPLAPGMVAPGMHNSIMTSMAASMMAASMASSMAASMSSSMASSSASTWSGDPSNSNKSMQWPYFG